MTDERPFFTIGHSNRSIDEFIGLLRESGIELLIDVRRLPGSNRYPHFNQDELSAALDKAGIGYRRLAGLTGRRPASKTVPPEVNAWWENRSFHNYADHALSPEFAGALDELIRDGRSQAVAVMCSEAVWWRCHRRIIADHLLVRGEEVLHIMGPGKIEPAELSAGALPGEDGSLTYPPDRRD